MTPPPTPTPHRDATSAVVPNLPQGPIAALTRPFVQFMHIESSSGVVLLICTAVALLAANVHGLAAGFESIWNTRMVLEVGEFSVLDYKGHPFTFGLVINEIFMAVFFFVVGLEIKRELVAGELRDPRRVVLPIAAAIGGVVAPVCLYQLLLPGEYAKSGWAIPMATDIAFVVGALALLGPRVPSSLKITLLTLAIVDDLIAVVVIAMFYTDHIHAGWLAAGIGGFGLVALLNRLGVRSVGIYVVIGGGIWLCALKSGVHPTVAGALLGLLTPANAWVSKSALKDLLNTALKVLKKDGEHADEEQQLKLRQKLDLATRESVSPLERLQTGLHPWVAFAIMPLFALANAGVALSIEGLKDPLGLAIAAALALGKPIGIVGMAGIVVALGWAKLPSGVTWMVMIGAGCLAGIGFTMSIFIAGLAFYGATPALLTASKTGILAGSAVSSIVGLAWLRLTLPKTAS